MSIVMGSDTASNTQPAASPGRWPQFSMSTKKERERWVMTLFIESYKKGKIVIVDEQEAPDFIVSVDGNKIGVELTEVFQDSHLGISRLKQRSSDGSSFTEDLISLIQPSIPFKFSIGINFNKNLPIKKSKKQAILEKLEELCVPAMINLKDHDHLELENYYDNLPDEIDDIYVYRFDAMDESIDSRPEGGIVSRLTINHLKTLLRSKEIKLSSYRDCDEQWLLIREGNYYSGSFSDVEIDLPIESRFDKVFLFRTRTREIIELK